MIKYNDRTGLYRYPFHIKEPVGNNIFSFEQRTQKMIYVPRMIEGRSTSIEESEDPSFVEIDEEGQERVNKGLKYFIRDGDRFIFDNHNHCYYFYKNFLRRSGKSSMGFVHVDQHKDLRDPDEQRSSFCEKSNIQEGSARLGLPDLPEVMRSDLSGYDLDEDIWDLLYTNLVLNVGNFIKPLLYEGKISKLAVIDSNDSMRSFSKKSFTSDYVLDLDLDFFSKDMEYMDRGERIGFIRDLAKDAQAIFIATSPYFIAFEEAKRALIEIFA